MTLDQLKESIATAAWFSNLARFENRGQMIAIRTMDNWRREETVVDAYHDGIAANLRWLPSDNSEEDPIHKPTLRSIAESLGREDVRHKQSLEVYRLTLSSLTNAPDSPLLVLGPHDLNLAARKSACYAARMAACEIIVDRQEFWCSLIPLFVAGNLPLGTLPDGKIVVF